VPKQSINSPAGQKALQDVQAQFNYKHSSLIHLRKRSDRSQTLDFYLIFENVQASNVGVSDIFMSFFLVPVLESSWAIGLYNLL
jgi:hypothetical protein